MERRCIRYATWLGTHSATHSIHRACRSGSPALDIIRSHVNYALAVRFPERLLAALMGGPIRSNLETWRQFGMSARPLDTTRAIEWSQCYRRGRRGAARFDEKTQKNGLRYENLGISARNCERDFRTAIWPTASLNFYYLFSDSKMYQLWLSPITTRIIYENK